MTTSGAGPRLAGVEIGGTKAIVVLGDGTNILETSRIAVTDSDATLSAVRDQLERWNDHAPIAALGIASFGPVGIIAGRDDHGRMLRTPKPGWTGANVLGPLAAAIDGPTRIDLDVNAAALAEGEYGAARGCTDHAYMTVGTGIGIGIVSGGQLVTGQMHPEAGHLRVRRTPGDAFPGICEFHGDCLAGLASGPALHARTGIDGAAIPPDHPVWDKVVDEIAEACVSLFMTLALQRIVIGGGVIVPRPSLVEAIAAATAAKAAGFPPFLGDRAPIHAAQLGNDAGPRGALILARAALSERS